MKLNFSILTSLAVLLVGFFSKQPYLWIPLSVLAAGFFDLFTRSWILSDKLGRAIKLSVLLKSFFALIGFYAMLGQIACVGLVVWWFVF